MQKITLNVEGMSCSHCEAAVKKGLGALGGVTDVSVDLKLKTVSVVFDEGKISQAAIEGNIEDLGYEVIK